MGRSPLRLSSDGLAMRVLTSPYLAVIVAMLCWAASTVVVRGLREEVPPMGLSFWRTLLGAAVVLPFAWRPLVQQIHLVRRHFWIILILSFLLFVGGNAVLFLSLQYTIAINVGVLNSFEPVLIIVAAWAIFRDRVTANQIAGVAVSLLGVFALIARGDPRALLALDFNAGDILVLFAYVSWALYAVYLRLAPRALDHSVMLFLLLFLGALMMIPLYLIEWAVDRPMTWGLPSIGAVVGLALFSSVFAVYLWNYAIQCLGPSLAGIFVHLIVAFTVIMAIAFLGEVFVWFHGVGIALIGAGIYLSIYRGRGEGG